MALLNSSQYWARVERYIKSHNSAWAWEIREVAKDYESWQSITWDQKYKKLVTYMDPLIASVEDAIEKETASSILDEALDTVSGILTGLKTEVSDLYNSTIAGIVDFIEPVFEGIDSTIDSITSTVEGLASWISTTFEDIVDTVSGLYNKATEYLYGLYQGFLTSVDEIINEAVELLEQFYNGAAELIKLMYEDAVSLLTGIYESAISGIQYVIDQVEITVNDALQLLSEAIDASLAVFIKVSESVTANLDTLLASLTGGIAPGLQALVAAAQHFMGVDNSPENISLAREINESFGMVFKALAAGAGGSDEMYAVYEGSGILRSALGGILATVALVVSNGLMGLTMASVVNEPRSNQLSIDAWKSNPTKIYSAAETAVMAARGLISPAEAYSVLEQNGYDNNRASLLIDNAKTGLDVERAISAYRRGILSNEGLTESLERLGIRQTDIGVIKNMIEILPPVQDIISMAVRDVFSPDAVSKFELFSDLPDEFVREAAKQGLSEDWAEKYWGAHWRLPSANQGFEMYHRGVIDEDTLKLLLRALDVSPFWREKLNQIAYSTITRVDIRRLYKLGLLDREGVIKRHRDIGYSPDDAVLMADFVESYVDVDEGSDGVDFKSLSTAQIKRLWSLGTITRDEAVEDLMEIKYSQKGATLLIESWIDEDEISFRETLIARLIRKAIRENRSESGIEDLFIDLNPTIEEMDRIRRTIEAEAIEADKLPSKAELKSMVESGIISVVDWREAMYASGYDDYWVDKYSQLWKLGA